MIFTALWQAKTSGDGIIFHDSDDQTVAWNFTFPNSIERR